MSWFKVDDGFADHPKVVELQAGRHWKGAIALWTLAGSWSSKHLTDGFVPCGVVSRLGGTTAEADALVVAGLWRGAENGYQFHGWNERNPTRSEVEAQRESGRKRVAKHRVQREGNALPPEGRTSLPSRPVPTRPDQEQIAAPIPLHPGATAGPPVTADFDARLRRAELLIATEYASRYEARTDQMWQSAGANRSAIHDAAKFFAANYPDDSAMHAAICLALDRFFASRRLAGDEWRLWKLAENPGRFLRAAPGPAKPDGHDSFGDDPVVDFSSTGSGNG